MGEKGDAVAFAAECDPDFVGIAPAPDPILATDSVRPSSCETIARILGRARSNYDMPVFREWIEHGRTPAKVELCYTSIILAKSLLKVISRPCAWPRLRSPLRLLSAAQQGQP